MYDFFFKSVNEKGHQLFSFRSGDDIQDNDDRTLFLKAFEPNQFEQNTYRFVYGLTTKLRNFKSKKEMTVKAFPKIVNWRDDLLLENGDALPKPETWPELDVPVQLENMIYVVEDIDIVSPFKKTKTTAGKNK